MDTNIPIAPEPPAGYICHLRARESATEEDARREAVILRDCFGYNPVLVRCVGHVGPGHAHAPWMDACGPEILADRTGENPWHVYTEDNDPE